MNDIKNKNANGIIYSDNQTAVRFFVDFSDEHKEYFSNIFAFMRGVSNWMYDKVKNNEVEAIKPFAIVWKDSSETSDRNLKHNPDISSLINKHFGSDYLCANVDALVWATIRNYSSYAGRNKKKKLSGPVRIRDKGFAPKSEMFAFDSENNEVLMRKIEKDKDDPCLRFKVTNVYYDNSNLLKYQKKNPEISKFQGGILSLKKGELILMAREVLEYSKAELTIGVDINKSKDTFLAWSVKIPSTGKKIFEKPKELSELEDRIKFLQKKIRGKDETDNQLSSSQRKGVRKKWDKAHKKQAALTEGKVFQILDELKETYGEFNLAIDTVAAGASLGTFGQDKVIASCMKWCKKNKHAHFLVPTPNTSRRCSKCGNVSKTARKLNQYVCKCGHVQQADENAAENIKVFAEAMMNNGFRMVGTLNRQYKIDAMVFLNKFFNLKRVQ